MDGCWTLFYAVILFLKKILLCSVRPHQRPFTNMFANVKFFVSIFTLYFLCGTACGNKQKAVENPASTPEVSHTAPSLPETRIPLVGAAQTEKYLSKITGNNISAVVNQTSMVGNTHLVDTLLAMGISIKKIFAPEHGFRGEADAGEQVKDGLDKKTQIPVISLYGKKKKPDAGDFAGIDLVIFDIQDVGVRFYTYISSMAYLMEACAENNIPLIILDRPNPNGHYVDGPILENGFESFVGLHPVPVVHGMTVGEYAKMVNGEGWLKGGIKCNLEIVPCQNYDHTVFYDLPVKPSPNLPNIRSIYLYPSICYFEGTEVSVGRGTDKQFQVIGAPGITLGDYEFTPVSKPGAKNPPHENELCRGYDLTTIDIEKIKNQRSIDLSYVLSFYNNYEPKNEFFLKTLFFDKLAGTDKLRKQIIAGKTEAEIKATWEEGIKNFKTVRSKYLLYKDFD